MESKEEYYCPKTFSEAYKNLTDIMSYTYNQVFYINMHLDVFNPAKYADGKLPEDVDDMLVELACLNFVLWVSKNAIDNCLHYIPKEIVNKYTEVISKLLETKPENLNQD